MNLRTVSIVLALGPLAACAAEAPNQSMATATSATTAAKGSSDIVDTAVAAGSFKTLVTALKAAGLDSTLRGAGPFTVFAPTDDAFAKLPPGTVEGLLRPENKAKLASILTYHVVSGRVSAADASKLTSAKTVEGQSLKIDASGGQVHIDKATVVTPDIACTNGVIHVIDTVLLPSS